MCFKHDPEAQECVSRLIDLALFSFCRVCFYHNENWNTKTARDNWLSYVGKPNRCHEPQSKVFVLVTQSHFPNQQAADVSEAKIGHMRRLSKDHRPTLCPIWLFLVGWSFFVEGAKLYCFLLSFADYFFFFFFLILWSAQSRATIDRQSVDFLGV